MDINGLSAYTKAPIEIEIKINGRNNKKSSIIFHCGKTELIEDEKKTGWCATKLDREGRINPISFIWVHKNSSEQLFRENWEVGILQKSLHRPERFLHVCKHESFDRRWVSNPVQTGVEGNHLFQYLLKQGLKTSSCKWVVFRWSFRSFIVIIFIVDVIFMSSSSQSSSSLSLLSSFSYILMRKSNLSSIMNFNWFFSDSTD